MHMQFSYSVLDLFREEPMVPDDVEDVDLNEFDPEADRQRRALYADDDDDPSAGPGVSCATQ